MSLHHTIAPLILSVGTVRACGDAGPWLDRAADKMGVNELRTLQYSTDGVGYTFGQAYTPASPWPKINVHGATRNINYETASMREQIEISRAEPLGGGAYPQSAHQKNDVFVGGDHAWNVNGTTVTPFAYFASARIHQLWVTPHGIIDAARSNDALPGFERGSGKRQKTVSFVQPGALAAKLYLDDDYRVAKVESRFPDNLLGETSVVTEYTGYQDFAGIEFPTRIVQTQDGFPLYDLTVRDVQPNAPAEILVPEAVVNFQESVVSTEVATGVWFLTGGSHNSVVIEMSDHVILVEAPLTDQRALPVIARVRELVPGKPLKYVINSHAHFDHAGGLRAAVAAGAIVVTQAGNKAYYERAFATPNTIKPDELARSGKVAVVEGVQDALVLSDNTRRVELHRLVGSNHSDSMLMVYLPAEKLLIEADLFTPGSNPNAPTPAVLDPEKVVLANNIERLGLSIERILPLHGRLATMLELLTAVGRQGSP
jgi:glyoxylase-like metal-dependent hydrolase (beta-lactamase superfamily II)